MANNSNLFPVQSHGNLLTTPNLVPTNGDQVTGSMPNLAGGINPPMKPFVHQAVNTANTPSLNNNANGYSSPALNSFNLPPLQTPQLNNVYNHHSSSQSSRNSSPAMNQPTPSQSSPHINQYKPPSHPQPGLPPQPPFGSNMSRPLLPPTSMQPPFSAPFVEQQHIRSMHPPPANQQAMYPTNPNQVRNNVLPPTTSLIQNPTLNNNKFVNSAPTGVVQSGPIPNRQMNSTVSSYLPSQNVLNPSYSPQQSMGPSPLNQNFPQMPPSNLSPNRPNIQSQMSQSNQATSQPFQGQYNQGSLPPQQPQQYKLPPQMPRNPNLLPPTNVQQTRPDLIPPQHTPVQQQLYHNNGQSDLSNQMNRMSVTQNSFGQLWGQESVDLLQCRNVLTEHKEPPPPVKLNHHFSESANCSPEIFRCTLNKIPENNNLLQKARLPLGILIHPFKDLNHLPVIQCSSIVRCRSCRTYINPFVYFVDLKRWKCNLCYRVNDLPEDFQYDPVSKTYGEPRRRPEILSATLEYVAPSEYMLRPPQPAVYCFVLDVSAEGARADYLTLFCATLAEHINELPGDSRTMLSFICFDHAVHFYSLRSGKPTQMTVMDIDDIFVPSPEDLLVNLAEKKSIIEELLEALPTMHATPCPSATRSALGSALQAAHKLVAPTGGRITVFQTCLPNIGPGALTAREDPNNRSSKEVAHLSPATDFYKRLALDCSGVQVAVDLFLLNSQYCDLSTLSGISQFSGGTVYHFPLFKGSRDNQAQDFKRCLIRYLTRKIGFEAVMRVRCTRGISIHTFHGSFFVRSTDLLALPNVSPDAGFGMQLSIEENLADAQQVCFQAALLYTSSKGERRIRVHTMCLPVVNSLNDVIHSADQQAIVGLLCKMGVDRSISSSLTDAREALLNAVVDALGTQKLGLSPGLISPMSIRLMPLYLSALLKHPAFRTGTSTRLDDRISAMCLMKTTPLNNLMRYIYPDLYPVDNLAQYTDYSTTDNDTVTPNPPRYHLSAEKVNANGAYLLDQESLMILYIGHRVDLEWLQNSLGVSHPSLIPPEGWTTLPLLETKENTLLHTFINQLNDDKPYAASLQIMLDTSPNRALFVDKMLDDRVEAALSYHEFLQHVKSQLK